MRAEAAAARRMIEVHNLALRARLLVEHICPTAASMAGAFTALPGRLCVFVGRS